jgi:hypothetical protein
VDGERLGFVTACALALGSVQFVVPFWGLLAAHYLGALSLAMRVSTHVSC